MKVDIAFAAIVPDRTLLEYSANDQVTQMDIMVGLSLISLSMPSD
jgi:hypothetical protein